jgi:hypothetical protein
VDLRGQTGAAEERAERRGTTEPAARATDTCAAGLGEGNASLASPRKHCCNQDPMSGCQIGAKIPTLHANKTNGVSLVSVMELVP